MFSSYRLDQYNDPDSFVEQVAIIFAGYEDAVLIRATDPSRRDCIQRTHKFPPSLSEVSEALDAAVKAILAERYITERISRGFLFDDRRGGFYNAKGERYVEKKHSLLPIIGQPGDAM